MFEWTVVAGIVFEDKDNNNKLDCIAIGTGTRVVGEERLELVPNGGALAGTLLTSIHIDTPDTYITSN